MNTPAPAQCGAIGIVAVADQVMMMNLGQPHTAVRHEARFNKGTCACSCSWRLLHKQASLHGALVGFHMRYCSRIALASLFGFMQLSSDHGSAYIAYGGMQGGATRVLHSSVTA